jgi:hypothetical protein
MTDGGDCSKMLHRSRWMCCAAMHFIAEAWRIKTLTTIKNCFMKCGFSNDHVSSNDSAVKYNEDTEDDWHS